LLEEDMMDLNNIELQFHEILGKESMTEEDIIKRIYLKKIEMLQ
jgi:chromatin remodeling complex protein RSC6